MNKLAIASILCVSTLASPSRADESPRVPVVADVNVSMEMPVASGGAITKTFSSRYYRDSFGRVRVESPTRIIITDTVAKKVTVLDPSTMTGVEKRLRRTAGDGERAQPGLEARYSGLPAPEVSELGERTIDGLSTRGLESVTRIPAYWQRLGNTEPMTHRVQRWVSDAVQLPLLIEVRSALGAVQTTRYTVLSLGDEPSPKLFEISEEYDIRVE